MPAASGRAAAPADTVQPEDAPADGAPGVDSAVVAAPSEAANVEAANVEAANAEAATADATAAGAAGEPAPSDGEAPAPAEPAVAAPAPPKPPPARPKGYVSVSSPTPGTVYIDGVTTGKPVPLWMHAVPAGSHRIELRGADGRVIGARTVDVPARQTVPVLFRANGGQ